MHPGLYRVVRFLGSSLFALLLVMIVQQPMALAKNDRDLEMWLPVTLDAHVTPHIRFQGEVQTRLGDNISQMDRLLIRGAVGAQITKSFSLWQGYGWVPSFEKLNVKQDTFEENFNNENRLYQQAMFENQWSKLKIVNRTRLEERFIDNTSGTSVRARHMVRLVYPITPSGKLSGVVYDEFFINLNHLRVGPQAGFDQNRLFVGLNQKLFKYTSLEAGYLWNPVNVFKSSINRTNHIILIGLNVKV
ncbi:MAG: DUF2490 domain-containing protein [Vampirovibrionales bacterium]|nr:DUF2490 domain-containing protein [Vampirovibrionales bacterium]